MDRITRLCMGLLMGPPIGPLMDRWGLERFPKESKKFAVVDLEKKLFELAPVLAAKGRRLIAALGFGGEPAAAVLRSWDCNRSRSFGFCKSVAKF